MTEIFKKVGNSIIQKFKSNKPKSLNVFKQQEYIDELESKLGISENTPEATSDKVETIKPEVKPAMETTHELCERVLKQNGVVVGEFKKDINTLSDYYKKEELEKTIKHEQLMEKVKKYSNPHVEPNEYSISAIDLNKGDEHLAFKISILEMNERRLELVKKEMEAKKQIKIVDEDYNNENRDATSEVFYLTKNKYYITYEEYNGRGRCFIKSEDSKEKYFDYLIKRLEGDCGDINRKIVGGYNYRNAEDLTKAEFLEIIKNKPTFNEVISSYCVHRNVNVSVFTKKITPIYG